MTQDTGSSAIPDDDRLWAALCYPFYLIIPLIVLFTEEQKEKDFVRYHAVQALILHIISLVVMAMLLVSIIGWCCLPFVWIVLLWPAYEAYQGKYVEIPVITAFAKNQKWF